MPLPLILTIVTVATIFACVLIATVCIRRWQARFLRAANRSEVRRAWKQVAALQSAELQIMEADKVLDLALRRLGYAGTLGDKLKASGARFSKLSDIWHAHRIRNRIAHEMGARITEQERKSVLRTVEHALRELGM